MGDGGAAGASRMEGTVSGSVRAGKAVGVGKEGRVEGKIYTQDAVISGRVHGSVSAESRLELQSTSQITGDIQALRMQLEEGASLEGQVTVGESYTKPVSAPETLSAHPTDHPEHVEMS